MIEQVRRILGLRRKTGNKLIISVEKLERRVALLEEGQLEEYNVERERSRNIAGSVYKGRVKNIEPGLKAMFVDIGLAMIALVAAPIRRLWTAEWKKSSARIENSQKSG